MTCHTMKGEDHKPGPHVSERSRFFVTSFIQLSTTRLFSVDEIGDSEMVFGELRPRIRHRLSGIHLTVGETSEKTQPDKASEKTDIVPSITSADGDEFGSQFPHSVPNSNLQCVDSEGNVDKETNSHLLHLHVSFHTQSSVARELGYEVGEESLEMEWLGPRLFMCCSATECKTWLEAIGREDLMVKVPKKLYNNFQILQGLVTWSGKRLLKSCGDYGGIDSNAKEEKDSQPSSTIASSEKSSQDFTERTENTHCPCMYKHDKLFDILRNACSKMTETDKLCCLMWDEMSLKANLCYNSNEDIVDGFERYSSNYSSDKIANQGLLFMVRGICSNYKQVSGSFLAHSSTPRNTLVELIGKAIEKLSSIGLKVVATVCDQGSNNQKANHLLGVTIDKPSFTVNDRKIVAFFYTPHLIKSTRNMFKKYSANLLKCVEYMTPEFDNNFGNLIFKPHVVQRFTSLTQDEVCSDFLAPTCNSDCKRYLISLFTRVLIHARLWKMNEKLPSNDNKKKEKKMKKVLHQ
ncbi:hypothetical protein ANN_26733 [Periplaneta americana]|uniref:Transposable element P transposase-like RNase H domain-containing protein n=1 Tax=Periplaneta americana TaxID=6978 RepID=A0ABQ8RZ64_PERAM|nr:hypothetical protein ANN_26733 [Periplaneta americana]